MSKANIEKLNQLLARVEQRRTEPRLHAVANLGNQHSARSENTNLVAATPPVRVVPSEPPDSFDAAFADMTGPSSMPPPAPSPVAAAPVAAAPVAAAPVAASARSASDATPRAPTEVLPAVPQRIPPAPALPFESAVLVTSSPRIEVARTFGELLELSLSLRPKA